MQLAQRIRWLRGWTASVLVASAAQRGGTLASTLYFVRFVGSGHFAAVVPLTPIAPLVNAMVLVGQDQAVLRRLLHEDNGDRLSVRATAQVWSIIIVATLVLGTLVSLGVAVLFHEPLYCTALSTAGGALMSLGQATAISQIRARRRGSHYVVCYFVYGASSLMARILCHHFGVASRPTWAIGDAVSGLLLFVVAFAISPPAWSHGIAYERRAGIRYGLPLLPNMVAQQVLGSGDRWVFSAAGVGAVQLATYVSAYQVANVVNIMLSEVNRSRQHHYVLRRDGGYDAVERDERRLLLAIVLLTAVPVAGISAALSVWNFADAFLVTLGISASFISIAFYLPAANLFSMTIGRTSALAWASLFGALANMVLNIGLVFSLGIWSGLIANFVGYGVMYEFLERQRQPT